LSEPSPLRAAAASWRVGVFWKSIVYLLFFIFGVTNFSGFWLLSFLMCFVGIAPILITSLLMSYRWYLKVYSPEVSKTMGSVFNRPYEFASSLWWPTFVMGRIDVRAHRSQMKSMGLKPLVVGDEAPDSEVWSVNGRESIKLRSLIAKKNICVITFGSYT